MDRYLKEQIRWLRKNQTASEQKLWDLLRNRQLDGLKFLRQHPLKVNHQGHEKHFIADFYCAEQQLVIEVDGKIHEQQSEYDTLRTALLNTKEIKVLRIKNEELDQLEICIQKIKQYLNSSSTIWFSHLI